MPASLPGVDIAAPFARFLTALSLTHPVYIVGGWLRDAIRGVPAKDADFATSAGAEDIRRLAQAHGLKIFADKVAERHGTYRMTSGVPHEVLDLATLRRDVARVGAREALVAFTDDITLDLARRDLTINGMAARYPGPATGHAALIDPFGGQSDLRGRTLRLIGQPMRRLQEDPLRLLRVARFACIGGRWRVAATTRQAMRRQAPLLRRVSFERMRDELQKALALPCPERFFARVRDARALGILWPGGPSFAIRQAERCLAKAARRTRDPQARWLSFVLGGSVPPACLTSVAAAAQRQAHHAEEVRARMQRLRFSRAACDEAHLAIVCFPWRPALLTGQTLVAWLTEVGPRGLVMARHNAVLLTRAQRLPAGPLRALWRRIEALLGRAEVPTLNTLAISGADLLRGGLVSPGPAMGRMLGELLQWAIAHSCWQDRERLLSQARHMAASAEPHS